ncbi:hypothetical protein ABK040_010714 [Willaertia magna]
MSLQQEEEENQTFSFSHYATVNFPVEIWLQIVQYLNLKELYYLSQVDIMMFNFIFCRDFKKEQNYIYSITNYFTNKTEKNRENKVYKIIQETVWKKQLIKYYPLFIYNTKVKNFLTVLQRRIKLIKNKYPHLLNYKKKYILDKNENNEQIIKEVVIEENEINNYNTLKDYNNNKQRIINFNFLDEGFIENCEWIYKCPLNYNEIEFDSLKNCITCHVCKEDVFRVRNEQDFLFHTDQGHCVAFTYKGEKKVGCILI